MTLRRQLCLFGGPNSIQHLELHVIQRHATVGSLFLDPPNEPFIMRRKRRAHPTAADLVQERPG